MMAAIILSLISVVFITLGGIIWRFKLASLIAGYDPTQVKNPDGLATWVGKCLVGTGATGFIIALISSLWVSKNAELYAFLAFMVISQIGLILTLFGVQKYQR